jgi:peptidoglycan/xylan/chitin deacetylase (PgdA/CDA1 family)
MIGVAAKFSDHEIVREFFELFKTDWEFERSGVDYDVVIRSDGDFGKKSNARLVIIYTSRPSHARSPLRNIPTCSGNNRILLLKEDRLPIYGAYLSFPESSESQLVDAFTRESVTLTLAQKQKTVLWIGYDLWAEIRYLFLNGQPELNAGIPALELHIELLRALLHQDNIPFAEVPPVPAGYKFIACLTHDVDHASIRAHKFDRTLAGFVYRAAVQSFFHFCSGRKSFADLLRNWLAVTSLPFVQLGLLPDIWSGFGKYAEIEGDLPSTFFVIPKDGDPGRLRNGATAPRSRTVRYALPKISNRLLCLTKSGHEIGLHGINAWLTVNEARGERAELQKAINGPVSPGISGVRMHWLYYDQLSPKTLDDAGFHYDSTVGYNRAIGYRSGTCQVYKALGAQRLMELPLHVMDTALFFPTCMNARPAEAKVKIKALITNAMRFGGVLTINWHDRSIAPERLWHRLYRDIIAELKSSGAWFATASQTVQWFEKRRRITAVSGVNIDEHTDARDGLSAGNLPGLTFQRNNPLPFAARRSTTATRSMGSPDLSADVEVNDALVQRARSNLAGSSSPVAVTNG